MVDESKNLEQKVEKIVDNSNEVIGPFLLESGNAESPPSISDKDRIFQSGDHDLTQRILSIISEAEDFICLSSFIIQGSEIFDEINKSCLRGVRVYILTSAEVHADDEVEEIEGTVSDRKEAARKLLVDLGGKALIKTGGSLHSKFILSDPLTKPRGMVFTANLTVRAINQNLELAVELSKKEVAELYRQFLNGFWVVADRTLSLSKDVGNSLKSAKKYPDFAGQEYTPEEIQWTMGNQCLLKNGVMDAIESAKESISLSAWTIDISHPVAKLLIKKSSEGVRVRIFTRPHVLNIGFINEIIKTGGQVYCHPLLHAKSIVIDDSYGMIMTANISKLGLDEGFETGVILNARQVQVLKNVHEEWKNRVQYFSVSQMKLMEVRRTRLDLSDKLTPINPPKYTKVVDHGKIYLENLEGYFNQEWDPGKIQKDYSAIKITHKATLIPPQLPSGAKKLEQQVNEGIGVYESKKEKFVCIKNQNQLIEGKSLANKLKAKLVLCT